jgi:hypothetical protein
MRDEFAGAPNIVYVKSDGSDSPPNDGSSWALAYATIDKALPRQTALLLTMLCTFR